MKPQTLTIEKLQSLCSEVNKCFPRAHVAIAGGAPRDLLHGKPIKDIDVFVNITSVANPDDRFATSDWFDDWVSGCSALAKEINCERWIPSHAPGADVQLNSNGYSYGAFTLVDFPSGFHMYPVQLVFIDEHPVDNVLRHFDFGLSQVWLTPNQLRMSDAYWHDHFGHRITYLQSAEPNEQRRLSSIQRVARLREKYQGWRFERCGGLVMPVQQPGAAS